MHDPTYPDCPHNYPPPAVKGTPCLCGSKEHIIWRTNKYVKQYGEKYRRLIENSLEWLDSKEETWNLDEPINRDEFIANLTAHAK